MSLSFHTTMKNPFVLLLLLLLRVLVTRPPARGSKILSFLPSTPSVPSSVPSPVPTTCLKDERTDGPRRTSLSQILLFTLKRFCGESASASHLARDQGGGHATSPRITCIHNPHQEAWAIGFALRLEEGAGEDSAVRRRGREREGWKTSVEGGR